MMQDELKKIVADQEISTRRFFETEKIIDREINLVKLRGFLKHPNILVISGVRRSGKSILGHLIFKGEKYAHINFDDERLAGFSVSDFDTLLQVFYQFHGKEVTCFLFDEIQNIPRWELFLTRLRVNNKIVITGSNAKMLSRELATHLTGRHIDCHLYPFSFTEHLKQKEINSSAISTIDQAILRKELEIYLQNGGFPEVDKLGTSILPVIYGDIINKDILFRRSIRHARTFKEMANYLLSNFGQALSLTKLSHIFQIKHLQTMKNYIDYLEESFLISIINKFSYKLKEQIIAPKKVYPVDTGMAAQMSFSSSENRGALMEAAVFLQLMRQKAYLYPEREIYFWQDYQNHEVDFIVKDKEKVILLIQVCENLSGINTRTREERALTSAAKELHCSNSLIITSEEEGEEKIAHLNLKILPLWKWLITITS